ncbi:uncharacterized protein LOC129796112 [Lutzomyia longipalpis]|uniref:uncharacterized protein LOC129796112 n=1 Tax=Lutzomyia longipalpis TaxID=7200 RepID=UPI002483A0ED|nr:uncharacterized protein LOC129796112 [Lutzomyia longipalpis]XP_055693816.1 uncharacterized protein LOC129796112 [Lutzomyia longipalpis]XP_055693818.1 uncharacterized protein LOC129796112 [Lutzomyia longipalpis]XP_055693819.1 uncharacterized protein LOC129796112 [Lutzomyia longipalpis]
MSQLCVVKHCRSQSSRKNISLYPFPNNKNLRKAWLDAIPVAKNWTLKKDSKICEIHFKDDDFQPRFEKKTKKLLKKSAIPSIFHSNRESTTNFRCVAPGCRSNKADSGKKGLIPFLSFPENPELRQKWMVSLGQPPDTKPSIKSRVCLNHFKLEDIMRFLMIDGVETSIPRGKVTVKPDAVPTEYPGTNHNIYNCTESNLNNICAVQDCRSHLSMREVELFSIPSVPDLQTKWSRVTPWRLNWKFTPNMKVCSEHFVTGDFHRRAKTDRLTLKEHAVPSIFPGKKKTDVDMVKICAEIQKQKEMEENEKRHLEDLVSNFDKLIENYRERIDRQTLAIYRARISSKWITFYRMGFKDGVPEVEATVNISDKMDISVFVKNQRIDLKYFDSIFNTNGVYLYYSQLENLLKAIPSDFKPNTDVNLMPKENVDILKKSLNSMIEECDHYDDDDANDVQRRLHRIYDQICTATKDKKRNYSIDTIIEGARILGRYPECYEMARKLVTYPPKLLQIYYMAKDDTNYPINEKSKREAMQNNSGSVENNSGPMENT